jgi:predicted NAD/FAD-binding protein
MGKRVAIVGSGCSGLGALWALRTSTDHEVHIFEAASRLGGHANTVTYEALNGQKVDVDTGFIVMNTATYPNFIRFLNALGIPTERTEMTFGLSRDQGAFEWAGTSLSSIFAQKRNIFNPGMWRLIFDVIRFNEFALDLLLEQPESELDPSTDTTSKLPSRETIGEYLDREHYSQEFRDDYLIPMTAAAWSTSPDICSSEFPAITLIRFMYNRQLLSTTSKRPDWLTIPGGSKQYIDAVMKHLSNDQVHLQSKVTALTPTKRGSVILTANERDYVFDHVILATHGNQALEILRSIASTQEAEILSGFRASRNVAVLHSDISLMPKRKVAWSAWNYITESPFPPMRSQTVSKVCLTYWMNLLQHIPENKFGPVLLTLNPLNMPDPRLAQGIWEYSHPLYNAAAIRSQRLLPKIQNIRGISYCGAWTKYGFHEDGFSSGLSVAVNHLGATLPFEFIDSTFARGKRPTLTMKNYLLRLVILLAQIALLLMERVWYAVVGLIDRRTASPRKTS